MSSDLFSPGEMETFRSRGPFLISHPLVIKSLSDILRSKPLLEGKRGTGGGNQYIEIRCYRNDEHVVTLTLYRPDLIVTDDGRRFRNKAASWGLPVDELISLTMREACAQNLRSLYRFVFEGMDRQYPVPVEWCDEVSAPIHREGSRWRERVNVPSPVAGRLSCYAAGEGRCHYAMNPNCSPTSPVDTVLVFETTAGWNQHGGAELFTFDNHEPSGGCVLLNDGTVRFIRTEEELKQLRWQ